MSVIKPVWHVYTPATCTDTISQCVFLSLSVKMYSKLTTGYNLHTLQKAFWPSSDVPVFLHLFLKDKVKLK